jgi:hypothetical protein
MKILILAVSLFAVTFATSNVYAGNCDTHSTDKKVKGSGI